MNRLPVPLPHGWAVAPLRGLIELRYGKSLPEEQREVGPNPVYGSNGRVGTHSRSLTIGEAIIVGRKGSAGAVHFSSGPCWPIDTTYYIDAFGPFTSKFLEHQLRFLNLSKHDTSTAIPGLNREKVYDQQVRVPPLPEQRRIVEAIETRFARLDAAVKALERARANLKRYRASVVRAAADGRLTGRKSEWGRRGLFDVADDLDGERVPVNAKERERRVGTVPYYGATGQVGWIDDNLFDDELVLLGEDGVDFLNPLKSKAYIIRGKSWVNNHAHVLRARSDEIDSRFLLIQLNATNYFGLANGTTRLKLTKSAMRKISFPLAPIDEQLAVVAEAERRFSVADEVGLEVEKGLVRAARLREALLKSAFEGRLAPQDPQDEPASSLLERIKMANRATSDSIRRGQRLLPAE